MKKYMEKGLRLLLLSLPLVMAAAPLVLLVSGTVMSQEELNLFLKPVLEGTEGSIGWRLLPYYPTLEHYRKVLLESPQFYAVFWNSVRLVTVILAGQLLLGVPAAWAFAVYRFRGSRALFYLYVILMLMPFQVTMLSQYLVLEQLGVMNTRLAVILPAVFSTFPIFLIYRSFCRIPSGLLEAGRIDGAGELALFWTIGLPLSMDGVLSAMVLGFLEYWNLIEQPLAFLKDKSLWPLSLYLPVGGADQAGTSFVVAVVTLIPALFVFALGRDYMEQGIVASGLKE